jgi:hypothetical protein
LLNYQDEYKGYQIVGSPDSREIDRVLGQPYRYKFIVSKDGKELFRLRVAATSEELVQVEEGKDIFLGFGPNNPLSEEVGTRGWGFGISQRVWDALRRVGVKELQRILDDSRFEKGKDYQMEYRSLAGAKFSS